MKKLTFILGFAFAGMLLLSSCGGDASTNEGEGTGNTETTDSNAEANSDSDSDSNSESTGASLVGTWKFKDMDPGMEVPEEQKAMFEKTLDEMREFNQITYNEDGSYYTQAKLFGSTSHDTGTYVLEGGILSSTSNRADTTLTYKVIKHTDSELVQSISQGAITSTITLEKI